MGKSLITPHKWRKIDKYEIKNKGCLPNLRNSNTIHVFSDYGGNHKESKYDMYSFLFLDLENSTPFLKITSDIRHKTQLEDRRITFKNLNDKVRLSIIDHFFEASEKANGLLYIILIDKNIDKFFSEKELSVIKEMYPELEKCKNKPFEKSLRIIHLISLILSGLSCQGQNVLNY